MKSSTKILALSIALALITALAFMHYVKNLQQQTTQGVPKVMVIAAAKNIPARTKITADMLKPEAYTAGDVPPGVYHAANALVGKYTAKPLVPNEIIFPSMLLQKGDPASFSLAVPEGQRAMAIQYVDIKDVGGLIVPGDKVDVLAVFPKDNMPSKEDVAKIVLQDVQILAVGHQTIDGNTPSIVDAAADSSKGKTVPVVNTVTLAVSPTQAEELAYAESNGQIRLLLRHSDDNAMVTTTGVNNTNALNGK